MASIRKEVFIEAAPELVWDAVRDVGALHTRLAPGFVTDTRLEGDARIVTFASGLVARERIVDVNDAERRLVWSVVESQPTHHNGALQVFGRSQGQPRRLDRRSPAARTGAGDSGHDGAGPGGDEEGDGKTGCRRRLMPAD